MPELLPNDCVVNFRPLPITLAVVKQMVRQVTIYDFPMNRDGGSQLKKEDKKEKEGKKRECRGRHIGFTQ